MRLHSQIGVMWWEEGIGHQECLLPARRGGSQTHADIRLWAPRRGDLFQPVYVCQQYCVATRAFASAREVRDNSCRQLSP
jgi:hypothetical protein